MKGQRGKKPSFNRTGSEIEASHPMTRALQKSHLMKRHGGQGRPMERSGGTKKKD